LLGLGVEPLFLLRQGRRVDPALLVRQRFGLVRRAPRSLGKREIGLPLFVRCKFRSQCGLLFGFADFQLRFHVVSRPPRVVRALPLVCGPSGDGFFNGQGCNGPFGR
jgi:hypothetical protein